MRELSAFPIGGKNDAYAEHFVGQSYLNTVSLNQVVVGNVTFEPSCRNDWHVHHADAGGGQVLMVTAGEGWYQEWGEPARRLKAGDVVNIPAEVKHWHGATAGSWFQHLAIEVPGEGCATEWLEPVDATEYESLESEPPNSDAAAAPKVTAGRDELGAFAPKFAELNDDVLFGQVWSREGTLSARDRSVVTVTTLMASGVLDSSLKYHILNAKNHGVSAEEMAELLTHAAFYAGWPKAWAALRMAKDVYGEE